MNLIMNILQRFLQNPKTTLAGVFSGTTLSVVASSVLDQAGCHLDQVSWWTVMGLIFGGPTLVGGASTDNGKAVIPAVAVAGDGILKCLALLLFIPSVLLIGCASYIDYGDGRYGVTKVSEHRSPFGTNGGFAVLQNCEGRYGNLGLEFTDCHDLTGYHPIYSQGQGGQVVSGAMTGLGFGLGSAFSGAGSVSSSAASSSAVSVPAKGH